MRNKYSSNFKRDYRWYLKMRHIFNFDGGDSMRHDIVYDKNGIDGLYAFFLWDSKGIMTTTKHPNILFSLLRTKASANFHAKMYAQGRADGTFPFIEFRAFCIKYNAPEWFKSAVENQKFKYYDQNEPILKTVAQHKIQYPYIS